MFWNFCYRVFRILASLELAVFIILALATILATGTIFESKYSAEIASKLVYRSIWMQGLLWLLILNLAAVAFSRWPWRKQHVGFLVTHLGIITLLLGSFITQRRGIDGSMMLAPGSSSRYVRVNENMLNVFRAVQGKSYELLLSERLDFNPLEQLKSPEHFMLPAEPKPLRLDILKYYPKASRDVVAEVDPTGKGVPAVHFSLRGSRATISDWFFQTELGNSRQYGPAEFRFVKGKPNPKLVPDKPTLFFYVDSKDAKAPSIAVVGRGAKEIRYLGPAVLGKAIPLGWMDFDLYIDEFKASAIPSVTYSPLDHTAPESYEVIEAELDGEKLWLELGSSGQIAKGSALYYLQYAKKEIDLGFDVLLKKFTIGYYQGTNRPESYSSLVQSGGVETEISMNHPLQQAGFTLYQASYEMDENTGTPRYSVLSVNQDPGRWIKYTGALMIVLGIISMFYFKPKYSGNHKMLKKETV